MSAIIEKEKDVAGDEWKGFEAYSQQAWIATVNVVVLDVVVVCLTTKSKSKKTSKKLTVTAKKEPNQNITLEKK